MDIPKPQTSVQGTGPQTEAKHDSDVHDSDKPVSAQWQHHSLESAPVRKKMQDEDKPESRDTGRSGEERSIDKTEPTDKAEESAVDKKKAHCEKLFLALLDGMDKGDIKPLMLTDAMEQACKKLQTPKEHLSPSENNAQIQMSKLGGHLMSFATVPSEQKERRRNVMLLALRHAATADADICLVRLMCWNVQAQLTRVASMDLLERKGLLDTLRSIENDGVPMSQWLLGAIRMGLIEHMEGFLAPGWAFFALQKASNWYCFSNFGDPVRFNFYELLGSDVDAFTPGVPGYEEALIDRAALLLVVKKICNVNTKDESINISRPILIEPITAFTRVLGDLKRHYLIGDREYASTAETRIQIERLLRNNDALFRRMGYCLLFFMHRYGIGGETNLKVAADTALKGAKEGLDVMSLEAARMFTACEHFRDAEESLNLFVEFAPQCSESVQNQIDLLRDRIREGNERQQLKLDEWLDEFGYGPSGADADASAPVGKKKKRKAKGKGRAKEKKAAQSADIHAASKKSIGELSPQRKEGEAGLPSKPGSELLSNPETASPEKASPEKASPEKASPEKALAKELSEGIEPLTTVVEKEAKETSRDYHLLCSTFWDRDVRKSIRKAKELKKDGYPDQAAVILNNTIEKNPVGMERALEEYAFCLMDLTHTDFSEKALSLLNDAEDALIKMFECKTGARATKPVDPYWAKRTIDQVLKDCKSYVSEQQFLEIRMGMYINMSAFGHLYSLKHGYCASAGAEKYRDFYQLRRQLYGE